MSISSYSRKRRSGCDRRYFAIDEEGKSDSARCANEATTGVRVTKFEPEGKVYDAKACDAVEVLQLTPSLPLTLRLRDAEGEHCGNAN